MKTLKRLLPITLLAMAAPSLAETLDDAWSTAVSSHRQIEAAGAMRDAASFELEQARSVRLPQLGISSGYTRLDTAPGFSFGESLSTGPIFDGDDFVTAGAQVSVPLFTSGAVSAGIEAAEYGARAADDQLSTVVQNIKLGVAEHYVGVLRAESAVSVAESYVASLETHTNDTRNRYEVGDVPQNDYLAASVTLADAEQRLLQARNNLDNARAAYNRFLGRPMVATVSLDPTINIDALLPANENLEQLIDTARISRRELAALDAQAEALRSQADTVRAMSRPQLALTGGYMYLENEFLTADKFWMAGVSLNWNLFDGGQSRKRSQAIDSKAAAIGYNRADLESMIALQVRRTWNDRGEADSRMKVAESAVEQANENLRVVRNRYQAGASTNSEVLDAEALREQALSNRDNARFEVELARLRLARAIGAL
jgi:outer membrane protein TolC